MSQLLSRLAVIATPFVVRVLGALDSLERSGTHIC